MVRLYRMLTAAVVVVASVVVVVPVSARVMAPAPIADRVARAAVVLVGTVTSIEEKPVFHDGTEFKIAVVKISDAVKGVKDQTHVRVAFQPMARFPSNSIQKDLNVLLFLSPVKGESFYRTQMYFDIVNKNSPMWDKDVASAKLCGKVASDTGKYLKEGKPDEKLLAAAMLIVEYRSPRNSSGKVAPIDPAQSKAILQVLAEADWGRQDVDGPLGFYSPQNLFFRLGVTPADGWTPPAGGNLAQAAQKWVREHADTFVIKKFLPAEE